jgi:hypothetical protein
MNMNSEGEHNQALLASLTLEPFDVILGRGRSHLHHPGNMRMKTLVRAARPRYKKAVTTRIQKTRITQEIVQAIQTSGDQPGRFLRHNARDGGWTQVDDEVARVKVGNAIRYKKEPSGAQVISDSLKSSHRRMGTSPDEEALSSETARNISLRQEQQVKNNIPLLSDEEILANLGYEMGLSRQEDRDTIGMTRNEKHRPSRALGPVRSTFMNDEEARGWTRVDGKAADADVRSTLQCDQIPNNAHELSSFNTFLSSYFPPSSMIPLPPIALQRGRVKQELLERDRTS